MCNHELENLKIDIDKIVVYDKELAIQKLNALQKQYDLKLKPAGALRFFEGQQYIEIKDLVSLMVGSSKNIDDLKTYWDKIRDTVSSY